MLILAFEVLPRPGREADYFELAAELKPALEASGGLLHLDRSRSRLRQGWFLSHQAWLDESSMARWRSHPTHHGAQAYGRTEILADYRLRVGQVIANFDRSTSTEVEEYPLPHSAAYAHPRSARQRFILSAVSRGPLAINPAGAEVFDSVYDAGLQVSLAEVDDVQSGLALVGGMAGEASLMAARLAIVSRDYGLSGRAEAPQYFEPVAGPY